MQNYAEILSKTKYSNLDELLFTAEKVGIDNEALQISINGFKRTGSLFDLKAIINALEYYEEWGLLTNHKYKN